MLEIRPTCEHCNKSLPNESKEAMICTFECTFCKDCVTNILFNVCPNCGGGLEKRPVRPAELLVKDPASLKVVFKPIVLEEFKTLLDKYSSIEPNER